MKKRIGLALLALGALPLVIVIAGWFELRHHNMTIGLFPDAETILALLFWADLFCLGIGFYLVAQSPRSS